ncbi:MAG: hypothetical protein WAS07_10640 [Micropruina sp.]
MDVLLVLAKVAIVVGLGAFAVLTGGRIVLAVFALAERRDRQDAGSKAADSGQPIPPDGPAGQTTEADEPPSLTAAGAQLRGGAWIGLLERLAIFASLVAGYPEGLAIALALKGLARYPELKATSSGAAERFIIGSFVSVLVAAGSAGVAMWLIRLF